MTSEITIKKEDLTIKFDDLGLALKIFVILGWITIGITLLGFAIGFIEGMASVVII